MLTGHCVCGATGWRLTEMPEDATSCNCTHCRRFGVLMAYAEEGQGGEITGETFQYIWGDRYIAFHHCPTCGNFLGWTDQSEEDGPHRFSVNLRMADDPAEVAAIPVQPFEGLVTFEDIPKRGDQCIADLWA
ncbi:GFA family protein [Pseudoroseicyclus sp. CXY001]|uniref:GFA family protein n=1 Tax=Pseudoroseicyclus sp. CXY001 TaxID=3242492 RepID=UPI00358DCC6E